VIYVSQLNVGKVIGKGGSTIKVTQPHTTHNEMVLRRHCIALRCGVLRCISLTICHVCCVS
jgi:hypothetical protein